MQNIKSTFTLPDMLVKELVEVSEEIGEKKSRIVANALEMYFDYIDLQIASRRAKEIESGDVKTLTSSELRKELGL